MPRRRSDQDKKPERRIFTFRKGVCGFCQDKKEPDYKDFEALKRFITDRGKIVARGRSGLCQKHQRRTAVAIKRARYLGLLPFVVQPSF